MGLPANVISLRCADRDGYDPEAFRLGPDEVPSVRVNMGPRGGRQRLFVPSTAWPELAAVVAAGVSGRSVGLWLAVRMQAKLERREWVRVRTHLRQSLGFTNRAAHSRAVAELERLGFIEVQRRKGYAPLVRLVPRRTGERTGEVEDKAGG
jgi:hypothetical protein